jgi:cell division protein FtsW
MRLRKSYTNIQKSSLDLNLCITVGVLLLFGLLLVYDSSLSHALRDFNDGYYYIKQQLIWVSLGLLIAGFFTVFDYHRLKIFALPSVVGSLILLLMVFIPGLGTQAGGAHRWLDLGVFTLQPSEIFKLAGILWLAAIYEKRAKYGAFLLLSGVGVVILALLQRDLGSAIVVVLMAVITYLIAGGSLIKVAMAIPVGILGFLVLVLSSEYRKKRVLAFLDPFSDPQGFTYHISQVLIALGSGGLFGLGLGQSRQKFYIPEVTTDSIFAVVGEELGFFGAAFLIFLFSLLIVRGFRIAQNAPDRFGMVLAGGITAWLGIQAVVNIGSMVALFPLTGVPLPFISYGGSALVVNLAAIGMILNISKVSKK